MKILVQPPRSGKTMAMIRMADDFNGYIVCRSQRDAYRIAELARNMGARIHFPVTYDEVDRHQYHAGGVHRFWFDGADDYLRARFPDVEIAGLTLTEETE
ncbi:MAG: hypothetical protein PHR35_22920 [Kiritimatiellae bacterium]|nr:hypothetical protein [Kiritimatiellia bacterium]